MGFRVDRAGLGKFAELMARNGEAGRHVRTYVHNTIEVGEYEQVGGQGIPHWFALDHDHLVARAVHRLTVLSDALTYMGFNVNDANADYEGADQASAAAFDATLRQVPHAALREHVPYQQRSTLLFADVSDPTVELTATMSSDVADLEPKLNEIDKFLGKLTDVQSESWYLRQIVANFIGRDPLKDFEELFSGDWQVFARYTKVWASCRAAANAIATNTAYSAEALGGAWEGNAADAAIAYTQRLTEGVLAEVAFFDYLIAICKAYVEMAFYAYQVVDYIVGELIDILCIVAEFEVTMLIPFVGQAYQQYRIWVAVAAGVVDNIRALEHGVEYLQAARSIPETEPPCLLESLVLPPHVSVPDQRFQPVR